ncbi:hypothetical protein BpHYR1_005178 [Brachionus plicatilis]|uniref:Uncharacterized protein n=1 Tax=Brachionus plicatilis TaxID=10195 RepID=A0A3M7RPT5_BRAPC|nr:hypothetical protein BpHYR1_005178 [Brachionus plicatilis]
MHKMRAFKPDELFGIQSLIDYVNCKNNGFEKNSSTVAMYTKNILYTSETDYNGKQMTTENKMNPNQKGSYQQQSYNTQYNAYNRNQKKFVNFSQILQSDQYQHQQHQQHKKLEEQKRSVNEEILNVDSGQNKDFSNPIYGQAILNNTLVKYLCDSGERRSLISLKLFNIIKKHDPQTILETYTGKDLFSCSGKIKIFGFVFLKKFVISPEVIMKNVRLIVTENVTDHDFILGRDLVQKIQDFRTKFCEMQGKIVKISSTCSTESIQINTETLENYPETFEAPNFRFKSIDDERQVVVDELRNISAKDVVDLRPNFKLDAIEQYRSLNDEQVKDEDIKWIIDLKKTHKD